MRKDLRVADNILSNQIDFFKRSNYTTMSESLNTLRLEVEMLKDFLSTTVNS